jgi:hypothetical protein
VIHSIAGFIADHRIVVVCLGALALVYSLLLCAAASRRRQREDYEFKRYARELGYANEFDGSRRTRIEADRGWGRTA